MRGEILGAIHDDPGISKSQLARRLGLAWGTVCYHVEALEAQGAVRAAAFGRERCLFPAALTPQAQRVCAASRATESRRLLEALKVARQCTLSGLCASTGMSRKIVRKHMRALVASGLVLNLSNGRPRFVLAVRFQTAAVTAHHGLAPAPLLAVGEEPLATVAG